MEGETQANSRAVKTTNATAAELKPGERARRMLVKHGITPPKDFTGWEALAIQVDAPDECIEREENWRWKFCENLTSMPVLTPAAAATNRNSLSKAWTK